MSSFMNHSSQFDKANASTIDGTNISVMQYTDGIQELDSQEQQHNCMNLALGKPTQSFRMPISRRVPKKNKFLKNPNNLDLFLCEISKSVEESDFCIFDDNLFISGIMRQFREMAPYFFKRAEKSEEKFMEAWRPLAEELRTKLDLP